MSGLPHRIVCCLGIIASSCIAVAAEPGEQSPVKVDAAAQVPLNFLLYLPQDYDAQEQWPLLLFLHGSGERGDDLEQVKVHGPPKLIAAGQHFPCIVVSPQCPSFRRWEMTQLDSLLTHVQATYKVDPDRVYVTGLSLGGYGTWALAANYPDRFAAIVPICGAGEKEAASRIAHIPTWVFHGGNDVPVPLMSSAEMVKAIEDAGGNPRFTVYPLVDHDSWTQSYDNPELYDWLLAQRRKPRD